MTRLLNTIHHRDSSRLTALRMTFIFGFLIAWQHSEWHLLSCHCEEISLNLSLRGAVRLRSKLLVDQLDIGFHVQGHYKRCKTKDVSRHGFCLELDTPLPIGSILPLEVYLPLEVSPTPVVALTKVVQVSSLKDNLFEIHVLTTKISKKGMAAVIEYASSKSEEIVL